MSVWSFDAAPPRGVQGDGDQSAPSRDGARKAATGRVGHLGGLEIARGLVGSNSTPSVRTSWDWLAGAELGPCSQDIMLARRPPQPAAGGRLIFAGGSRAREVGAAPSVSASAKRGERPSNVSLEPEASLTPRNS